MEGITLSNQRGQATLPNLELTSLARYLLILRAFQCRKKYFNFQSLEVVEDVDPDLINNILAYPGRLSMQKELLNFQSLEVGKGGLPPLNYENQLRVYS